MSGGQTRYEVVYTMSRPVLEPEWTLATRLIGGWLEASAAAHPTVFTGATIRLDPDAVFLELRDAEDLIIERLGTTSIWSARTGSADAAQVLAGVLLCLQFACGADVMQLSGSNAGLWQAAARALTPVWGASLTARQLTPRRHRADTLVYVDHGENGRITRDYFRTHLGLDETQLPDRDFRDIVASD